MAPATIDPTLIATLSRVQEFLQARRVPCYVVGGLLRDQLIGRPATGWNVDLAVPREALAVSRALAERLHGAFVVLDEAAGSARIIVHADAQRIELDLSEFRGATLEDDLSRRDFTINAMAVALSDWLRAPRDPVPIVDPLGGRKAIARKTLIACFPGTFEEDPVRLLRSFRFAAQLSFAIEDATRALMAPALRGLSRVSGERLRDELMAIFETDRAHAAVCALNELGALDVIVPELSAGRGVEQGPLHHLDVLEHQLEAVAQADRILADFVEFSPALRGPLADYCARQLVERRSRKSLIKLSGLLHDVGKPARRTVEADGEVWFLGHEETGAQLASGIVERLRLSNREAHMVCQLVRHHLRPGFLSREPSLSRRAIYRFFKDLGDDGPGCLLTWWTDRMATRGPRSRLDQLGQQRGRLEELLNAYFFKEEEVVRPPRLVDGHQLMEAFHLDPGPRVGELLAAIEEAQAEGRIRTADQALALARELLDTPRTR